MEEESNNSQINKNRIERYIEKLEHLNKLFKKINEWTINLEENEFLSLDLKEKFGIYHASQIITEIITDIIAMVTKDLKVKPKDDYSNIEYIEEKGLISRELAFNLKKLNGLRNVLVHDYNGLDDRLAFKGIKEYNPFIEQFKEVMKKWLKKVS